MTSSTAQTVKDEARALYHRGLKEKAEGRLDDAIAYIDAALAANPDFPEALCSGGYILQTTGHYDGALAFYSRAIELDPDYFDALFNRGCLQFALNRLDLAIADFSRVAELQPNDAGARSNLGAALYQSGRLTESVDALRAALALDPALIEAAARLIVASERPVIYAGGGILKARGAEALRALAELLDIPVVTTLMARGAIPDDHPLCLGMPGMHGNYTAVTSMQESDLLIALGSRFDDRVTGKLDGFAPEAKIIHVDIDPAELGKVRRPDVGITGDARLVIEELIVALKGLGAPEVQPDRAAWKQTISGWQEKYPLTYEQSDPGELLKPQFVLETLRDNTPEDTIVTSDVGQHQMFASQYWKFRHPYTWINSGGAGTMGFSVPALSLIHI